MFAASFAMTQKDCNEWMDRIAVNTASIFFKSQTNFNLNFAFFKFDKNSFNILLPKLSYAWVVGLDIWWINNYSKHECFIPLFIYINTNSYTLPNLKSHVMFFSVLWCVNIVFSNCIICFPFLFFGQFW